MRFFQPTFVNRFQLNNFFHSWNHIFWMISQNIFICSFSFCRVCEGTRPMVEFMLSGKIFFGLFCWVWGDKTKTRFVQLMKQTKTFYLQIRASMFDEHPCFERNFMWTIPQNTPVCGMRLKITSTNFQQNKTPNNQLWTQGSSAPQAAPKKAGLAIKDPLTKQPINFDQVCSCWIVRAD